MKLIASLLFLVWLQVDASQLIQIHEKESKLRGRSLISFSAFNKLISEGGTEIAREGDAGSSPTVEPETALASNTEAPATLPPTVSPTILPTKNTTILPTGRPTTTDAPSTSAPTDSPTTSSPSTSTPKTPEPTQSPSVAISTSPTNPPTMIPTGTPTTDSPTTYSPSTSTPTTPEPTESPSVASPTTSGPKKGPNTVPATSEPTTTGIPTSIPTTKPHLPTLQNGVGTTRTSYISLELKGESASSSNEGTLDSICNITQSYVNAITKRSFGKSTVTSVDCNVSAGHVHATTKTEFPNEIQAPDAITYDDYIQVVMTSDETISTLPTKISEAASSLGVDQEVKASVDVSVYPPVIQLSFEELEDSAATIRSSPFATGATIILVLAAWTT